MTKNIVIKEWFSDSTRLFLISFAALFFEILIIRWLSSEIRMFAFMKNLSLMACVLGLGIGCASVNPAGQSRSSLTNFLILFAGLAAILAFAPAIGLTGMTFIVTPELLSWQFQVESVAQFLKNSICLLSIFMLVVAIFDMLGRELGLQISLQQFALKAYGINLLGSLAGVLAFSLLSMLGASPLVWILLGLLSLSPFCFSCRRDAACLLSSIIVSGMFAFVSVGSSQWSPYYRIDLRPLNRYIKDNHMIETAYKLGTIVEVNHMQHQRTFDLAPDFLRLHPELLQSAEFKTYSLPYAAAKNPGAVLVLGAGTGNDVAAALTHGAKSVDAVEIDPTIQRIGFKIHPQLPYKDPRVTVYINDARAYLAGNRKSYDTIIFGHLDSHTALSTMSSVRLDNYLYTKESLASASAHLSERGIAALSFSAQMPWLQARLYRLVKSVYGKEPLMLLTGFDGSQSVLILWGPGLDAVRGEIEREHAPQVVDLRVLAAIPTEVPTDDWPFLYQRYKNVPLVYAGMLAFIMLIAVFFVSNRFKLRPQLLVSNSQFFFLGAGFLLLETRGMLAVAALFGSTWIVNSIVIAIVLTMAWLSNRAVGRFAALTENKGYIGLFIALTCMYILPLSQYSGESFLLKSAVALIIIGSPFIFTGIIFSRAFSRAGAPQTALGVNILGAILGGCLEYLSAITGTSGLTLLAAAIYLLAYLSSKYLVNADPTLNEQS